VSQSDQAQLHFWEGTNDQRSPHHPVCQIFSEQRWEYLARTLDLSEIAAVIDIGCGRGMATNYLERKVPMICGADFSFQQIKANPSKHEKIVATGESLPFTDRSFDLAMCWELLHHADSPERVIGEMARVSRKWIVIFEPNLLNPACLAFSLLTPSERKALLLTSRRIHDTLNAHGFEIQTFKRVGLIPPNRSPMWLAKVLSRAPFVAPGIGISRLWIAKRHV
jgi:SAM-dependent methyltransferase